MKTLARTVSPAFLGLACALAVLAACQGQESRTPADTAPAAAPATAPADEAPHAESAWSSMNREQRVELMKHKVLPAMKAAFGKFDADEFGAMNCATCHGAGAKDKTFKMPNPALPKLPATPEGFQQLAIDEPEAMKFMSETVVPQMAAILGEKPYDHATNTGFGCFECHTVKK